MLSSHIVWQHGSIIAQCLLQVWSVMSRSGILDIMVNSGIPALVAQPSHTAALVDLPVTTCAAMATGIHSPLHSWAFRRICLSSPRREKCQGVCLSVTWPAWHDFVKLRPIERKRTLVGNSLKKLIVYSFPPKIKLSIPLRVCVCDHLPPVSQVTQWGLSTSVLTFLQTSSLLSLPPS